MNSSSFGVFASQTLLLLLLLLLPLIISPVLLVSATGSDLPTLTTIYCNNTSPVTLVVAPYTWNVDNLISFNTRAYYYQGVPLIPGPTILLTPNTTCTLTLMNNLSTTSSVSTCDFHSNSFHCPDTTNLHTHGLHIGPNQDDISVTVLPGNSHVYTYTIAEGHLMGTHWYHAHKHGSTSLQVLGGLVGALLVQPESNYNLPSDLQQLYASAQLLVLQHVHMDDDPGYYSSVMYTYGYVTVANDFVINAGETQTVSPNLTTITTGSPTDFYVVNGKYQPVVTLTANQVSLLRFIHTGPARIVELEIVNAASSGCTMQLIARDGVFQPIPYINLTAIVMYPATRADVAFLCTTPTGSNYITIQAYNNSNRSFILGAEQRLSQSVMFSLRVNAATGVSTSFPTSQAPYPSYLRNVSTDTPTANASVILNHINSSYMLINNIPFQGFTNLVFQYNFCLNRTYELTIGPPGAPPAGGGGGGGGPPPGGHPGPFNHGMHGNQHQTSHSRRLLQSTGSLTGLGSHPYHQHINHFMVTSLNGIDNNQAADIVRVGEWRDTAPALENQHTGTGLTFKFRPLDHTGIMIMHCHILNHEDFGMMGMYNISDCGNANITDITGSGNTNNNNNNTNNNNGTSAASNVHNLVNSWLIIATVFAFFLNLLF